MLSGRYVDDLLALIKEAYKYVYVIRMQKAYSWYFFDVREETTPHGIVWTPYMSQARAFATEESVEEFKAHYITPRKVEILRIETEV